jgi:hypothetical protein
MRQECNIEGSDKCFGSWMPRDFDVPFYASQLFFAARNNRILVDYNEAERPSCGERYQTNDRRPTIP